MARGYTEQWLAARQAKIASASDALLAPELPLQPNSDRRKFAAVLPWPPTLNHNVGAGKYGYFLTDEHRVFRRDVLGLVQAQRPATLRGALRLTMRVFPPDKRRRDISNLIKPVEDALQAAGLFANDEQIDELDIKRVRASLLEGRAGSVHVTVEEI